MKILALEFSTDRRSTAIVESNSGNILGSAFEIGGRSTKAIFLVEEVLRQASLEREQIDVIAVGIGPGSYTGIRAAVALVQGWQLAANIKTIGISSAECLAKQAQSAGKLGKVNIIIDAQRNEFYLSGYSISASNLSEIEPLRIVTRTEVENRFNSGEFIVGSEANRYFGSSENIYPDAATLGKIAGERTDFVPAEKLEPIYLRETSFVKAPAPRIIP